MKTFKKMISILVPIGFAVGAAVPLTTLAHDKVAERANTYASCDVNHDGVIDILDYIAVNKYIMGLKQYNNYNWLDANQNMVIDEEDANYVWAQIFHPQYSYTSCFVDREYNLGTLTETNVSFPSVGSLFVPDDFNSSSNGRTYLKHTCGYNAYQYTSYTLPVPSTRGDDPDHIINFDDSRYSTTLTENTGIIDIQLTFPNSTSRGTGFVVGDHVIATAAHVVYNVGTEAFPSSITLTLHNNNATLSNISVTPVEIHIPYDYAHYSGTATNFQKDIEMTPYDYALITVNDSLIEELGCTCFSLGTTYNLNTSGFQNIPLYLTGDPAGANGVVYTGKGHVTLPTDTNYDYQIEKVLYHDIDSTGGQSGSPVYTITKRYYNTQPKYIYTAIGIFHGGQSYPLGSPYFISEYGIINTACRTTKYQLQFYNNNSHLYYGI